MMNFKVLYTKKPFLNFHKTINKHEYPQTPNNAGKSLPVRIRKTGKEKTEKTEYVRINNRITQSGPVFENTYYTFFSDFKK